MEAENIDVESCIRLDSPVNNLECDVSAYEFDSQDAIITPQIGMEFDSQDAAYKFYNQYALKTGFGVRRGSSHSSRSDKTKVISKTFVCNKQGQKELKITEEGGDREVNCKRATRVGCGARMKINLTAFGTWKIGKFVAEHENHELTSPNKTSKHWSHKRLHREPRVRNLITALHSEGLSNANIARVVNVFEPSIEDSVNGQQVHDHLRIERKSNIGQNCVKIIRNFQEKKANDPDFFFSFELTTDRTLRSVFWADGRSRMSYLKFGDVIIFDVTYRTNSFSLPFAPFTGINHHRQSSLFGCALLADETEDTFVWLFQQWLHCMWGKAPGAIITDQDAAIGNAIARVLPHTRHRYCDWHLDRNIGEHMLQLKAIHGAEFELYFNRLRSSDNILEAEVCWKELMERYKLGAKTWLPKLWQRRESWVPCYLKDTFLAGARTSQRAESINSFFDTFVNARTPLHEFVVQYDKAVASRCAAEENEDFMTMNSEPILSSHWKAEKLAGTCYTKALFGIFKQEVKDGLSYWNKKVSKEGSVIKYIVGRPDVDQSRWKNVDYDSVGVIVSCECKQFENAGILCRHALNILWKKKVLEIPDRYILKRWTISARHRASPTCVSVSSEKIEVDREMRWDIRYKCNKVLEEAYKSATFYESFDMLLSNLLLEIDKNKEIDHEHMEPDMQSLEHVSQVGSSTPNFQSNDLFPEITIRDPTGPTNTKGRPRHTKRMQSGFEASQKENQKKKKTCSFCKEKGHYITGCKQAKAAAAIDAMHTEPNRNILD